MTDSLVLAGKSLTVMTGASVDASNSTTKLYKCHQGNISISANNALMMMLLHPWVLLTHPFPGEVPFAL